MSEKTLKQLFCPVIRILSSYKQMSRPRVLMYFIRICIDSQRMLRR